MNAVGRRGPNWPAEVTTRARELHAQGLGMPEIGRQLGVPVRTIQGWMWRGPRRPNRSATIIRRARALDAKGITPPEIGLRLGVPVRTIYQWLGRGKTGQMRTLRELLRKLSVQDLGRVVALARSLAEPVSHEHRTLKPPPTDTTASPASSPSG